MPSIKKPKVGYQTRVCKAETSRLETFVRELIYQLSGREYNLTRPGVAPVDVLDAVTKAVLYAAMKVNIRL